MDVQTARLVSTITVGARPLKLVAAHDGRSVYSLGDDSVITVIDVVHSAIEHRYELTGRAASMAISPDDKLLYITLSDRRSLILFDTQSGRQNAEVRVGPRPA